MAKGGKKGPNPASEKQAEHLSGVFEANGRLENAKDVGIFARLQPNKIDLLDLVPDDQGNVSIDAQPGAELFIYDLNNTSSGTINFHINNFDPDEDKIVFINADAEDELQNPIDSILPDAATPNFYIENVLHFNDQSVTIESSTEWIDLPGANTIRIQDIYFDADSSTYPTTQSTDYIHLDEIPQDPLTYPDQDTSPNESEGSIVIYEDDLFLSA